MPAEKQVVFHALAALGSLPGKKITNVEVDARGRVLRLVFDGGSSARIAIGDFRDRGEINPQLELTVIEPRLVFCDRPGCGICGLHAHSKPQVRYPMLRGRCGTCLNRQGVYCDLCGNGIEPPIRAWLAKEQRPLPWWCDKERLEGAILKALQDNGELLAYEIQRQVNTGSIVGGPGSTTIADCLKELRLKGVVYKVEKTARWGIA